MTATAVVDFQWGDGGKGKIIDHISYFSNIKLGARGKGGNNSGHSVSAEGKNAILHLIPSCVVSGKRAAIGRGCVVYPKGLTEEIRDLDLIGVKNIDLMVDERAHVITDQHIEEDKGDKKIGTTGRGIGPCYTAKYSRTGIRMVDYAEEHPEFRKILGDVAVLVNGYLDRRKDVLLEGAQGFGLCIDNGTYPFVTSSNTTVTGLCDGVGVSERRLERTIGVVKAYPTRVGNGPFPTQLGTNRKIKRENIGLTASDLEGVTKGDEYSLGKFLRIKGHEYGATTGRKRKPGWFDAVEVRYATLVNHPGEIALTKLDILSGLEKLKICTEYEMENGKTLTYPHADAKVLWKCKPVYEEMEGWKEDITGVRKFEKLPKNAQTYVNKIEELSGVPVTMIGVGPERNQIILRVLR
jgi:adenylosuccinate synthase